ncbi:MAG: type II toxin-antitoxin system RelE/ParE family toxin [Candidatus Hydrogenedentes bacterium]|nr:type II toxin-antitoxin system RelE/ParE family toxin [Candidatus Hydrogenedentota bacterium]
MKGVTLHNEAKAELAEAIAYYAGQRAGLGRDFRAVVDAAIQEIRRRPKLYPKHIEEIRKRTLQRFPYTIYYAELEDGIYVLAIAHQSREPGYWLDRHIEV